MPAPHSLPGFADVLDAAARIASHAHVTPVLRSRSLDEAAGAHLRFKAEHLQRVGAFKFRGACNAVWSLADEVAARGVATHSSGNHGAALALAARVRGIPCHVVVPEGAVQAKLAAIERAGAILHRCAPTIDAREAAFGEIEHRAVDGMNLDQRLLAVPCQLGGEAGARHRVPLVADAAGVEHEGEIVRSGGGRRTEWRDDEPGLGVCREEAPVGEEARRIPSPLVGEG